MSGHTTDNDDLNTSRMPFTAHLRELRKRLVYSFIAIGIGFGICYYFSKPIFRLMMRPLLQSMGEGDHLIYTGLPEAFFIYLKVGLWGGVLLALPGSVLPAVGLCRARACTVTKDVM